MELRTDYSNIKFANNGRLKLLIIHISLYGCKSIDEIKEAMAWTFADAKLANFAISTLQNQYYFWFKVC